MKICNFTVLGHRVLLIYKRKMRLYRRVEAQAVAEAALRTEGIYPDDSRYGCLGIGPAMVVFSA